MTIRPNLLPMRSAHDGIGDDLAHRAPRVGGGAPDGPVGRLRDAHGHDAALALVRRAPLGLALLARQVPLGPPAGVVGWQRSDRLAARTPAKAVLAGVLRARPALAVDEVEPG